MLLREIDALTIGDHSHLTLEDNCYFMREYHARKGFQGGETNDLILNLKKSPKVKGTPQWRYKLAAIRQIGDEMRECLAGEKNDHQWLKDVCFVSPPAKLSPTSTGITGDR